MSVAGVVAGTPSPPVPDAHRIMTPPGPGVLEFTSVPLKPGFSQNGCGFRSAEESLYLFPDLHYKLIMNQTSQKKGENWALQCLRGWSCHPGKGLQTVIAHLAALAPVCQPSGDRFWGTWTDAATSSRGWMMLCSQAQHVLLSVSPGPEIIAVGRWAQAELKWEGIPETALALLGLYLRLLLWPGPGFPALWL
uniref:Uncharacterized protein n=1 Tax=Colobus angolensis palliatus TaxID=336983 RepID=A0A2K5JX93_COLAP